MNQQKKYILVSLFTLLILGFQNCSPTAFNSITEDVSSLASKASGNGGGYEGKPDDLYLRYLPQYSCEGTESFKDRIFIKDGKYFLQETVFNQCGANPRELLPTELLRSPYQAEFIIALDFLFKRFDKAPESTPSLLPETLCRDNFEKPTFEIVTHFDSSNNTANTNVYFLNSVSKSPEQQFDSSTSRLFSGRSVQYSAFNGNLRFQVDLTAGAGTYLRRFKATLQQAPEFLGTANSSATLTCVTGGGLDSKVWPLKEMVDRNLDYVRVGKYNGDIFFVGRLPTHVNWSRLYRFKAGQKYQDLSAEILGNDFAVRRFSLLENSDKVMLVGNPASDSWNSYGYIFNPDQKGSARRFFNRGNERAEGLTGYGAFDSTPIEIAPGIFGMSISKLLMIDGRGNYTDQFYRIFNYATEAIDDFLKSKRPVQTIFNRQKTLALSFIDDLSGIPQLQTLTLATRVTRSFPLTAPGDCKVTLSISGWQTANLIYSEATNEAIFQVACATTTHVYAVSLNSGSIRLIAENQLVTWASKDGNQLLLAAPGQVITDLGGYAAVTYNPLEMAFYNMASNRRITTGIDPHLRTSTDPASLSSFSNHMYQSGYLALIATNSSNHVFGLSTGVDPKLHAYDPASGLSKNICNIDEESLVTIGDVNAKTAYALTYHRELKAFKYYALSFSEGCALMNSFPSPDRILVRNIIATAWGIGLALMKDANAYTDTSATDHVIFIPHNNRPTLHLNPDGRELKRIQQMELSADGNFIYLVGDRGQMGGGVSSLFRFDPMK